MVCEACSAAGQFVNSDARFCTHCGRPLTHQAYGTQPGWNAFASHLTRPRQGRMLAGVCAGVAAKYGWDPVLVRVLAVVLFFGGFGTLALIYVAAWVIIPNEPLMYAVPAAPQGFSGSTPVA